MSWSYDLTLTNDMDKVRLHCGDTDRDKPQLQNEELNYLLDLAGSVYGAAALACQALATKYSRLADKAVGDLRIQQSQLSEHYVARARELERLNGGAASTAKLPYAGGLTWTDEQIDLTDVDLIQPYFRVSGMSDPNRSDPTVSPRY